VLRYREDRSAAEADTIDEVRRIHRVPDTSADSEGSE